MVLTPFRFDNNFAPHFKIQSAAVGRCTCPPGLFRHVRLQWLPDARLHRTDDAVDGSIGLLSEDAPQSKVTGIHVRRAGGSDVLQREHRHLLAARSLGAVWNPRGPG